MEKQKARIATNSNRNRKKRNKIGQTMKQNKRNYTSGISSHTRNINHLSNNQH